MPNFKHQFDASAVHASDAEFIKANLSKSGKPTVELMETLSLHMAASMGQITSILLQMPQHRHTLLHDLKWFVTPALLTGQFIVVQAADSSTGLTGPVATALWARVSPEVDKRLSQTPAKPLRLETEDWSSGSIYWLVEAAGDNDAINALLSGLVERRFPEGIKSWVLGPNGHELRSLTKTDFAKV